jgi:hypothetical protein
MHRTVAFIGLLVGVSVVCSNSLSRRYQEQEGGPTALAKAIAEAKTSLEQALDVVSREGKPLSARFEIEDGMLQVSVYRVKDDQFAEVILNPDTGAVAEVDPITSGSDYSVAQDRNAVMTKAKRSLRAALTQSLNGNAGFRVGIVAPSLKDGHPVAEITLVKGDEWKKVSVSLD